MASDLGGARHVKYTRTRTPKRIKALFLALNWYLTDKYDIEHMQEYIEEAGDGPHYSHEELMASLARGYVDRFNTKRLRKKHADDLYWLGRSKHIDWKRFQK